jgi:hypothetical protein
MNPVWRTCGDFMEISKSGWILYFKKIILKIGPVKKYELKVKG